MRTRLVSLRPCNSRCFFGECNAVLQDITENSIRPLDETESLQRMLAQIMVTDSSDLATQLDLAGALIENVPMFELACNMEIEAAQVAYEGMNKRK